MVSYIARYQRIPDEVLRQDVLDQLRILAYLHAEEQRQRRVAIALARRVGVSWRLLAEPLGVGSPQGAEQTYLRLINEADGGARDEKAARRATSAATAERDRLASNATRLAALVRMLAKMSESFPLDVGDEAGVDVAAWAAEAREMPRTGPVPHLVAVESRLLLAELRGRRADLSDDLRDLVDEGVRVLAEIDTE